VALRRGATTVLQDVWEPRRGVSLIQSEGVTYTAGSTPFLSDVCDASAATGITPKAFRSYLCAGAPIPSALVERALAEMSLKVCSAWGMTEVIAGTLTEPGRAVEKSPKADGRAMDGMEVRVVDFNGKPVPAGVTGRLMVRGAQRGMGYYKRPNLMALDGEGWLDSGDLAHMDAEGYIRIAGRTKDVLIRGGENVPVVEIENLLYKHPSVAGVAIVGFPDRRLGERACAFIVTRPGTSIDLPEVHRYLAETKTAKQYWPERVERVDDLPRTPTGKVQKFVLRDLAKQFGDAR
jgi:cyclohexanecarboxylate-CoA ligase